jgi:mono/diheme cytochrome c family protein
LPTKIAVLVLAVGIGALAASCGGDEEATPPPTTATTVATPPPPPPPPKPPAKPKPEKLRGDPAAGAAVFKANDCGSCHTLKAAGATGNTGPDLDQLQPGQTATALVVLQGLSIMPAYNLNDKDLADLAAFVYESTH